MNLIYQHKNRNGDHFVALHFETQKQKILVSGSRTRISAVNNCPNCRRWVWAGILEGRQDAHSVQLALNDIHDFTQATTALHEAGKEKED